LGKWVFLNAMGKFQQLWAIDLRIASDPGQLPDFIQFPQGQKVPKLNNFRGGKPAHMPWSFPSFRIFKDHWP
jgi:hypothetical protein